MNPDQLLERIAKTLKEEIGPAVGAEYPRTQAYLSAVVLQKLAGQLRYEQQHLEAEQRDYVALSNELERALENGDYPAGLAAAQREFARALDKTTLARLIEALYAEREALGAPSFEALLTPIRRVLRASLDRQMEYA